MEIFYLDHFFLPFTVTAEICRDCDQDSWRHRCTMSELLMDPSLPWRIGARCFCLFAKLLISQWTRSSAAKHYFYLFLEELLDKDLACNLVTTHHLHMTQKLEILALLAFSTGSLISLYAKCSKKVFNFYFNFYFEGKLFETTCGHESNNFDQNE